MVLGGLGAFNIGTDEWKTKKNMYEKQRSYAKEVLTTNKNNMPMRSPSEKSKELPEISTAYIMR